MKQYWKSWEKLDSAEGISKEDTLQTYLSYRELKDREHYHFKMLHVVETACEFICVYSWKW